MSRFSNAYSLVPIGSRLMMRAARARAAISGTASRVIAVIAALAVLVGAQSIVRVERGVSAAAFRSFSSSASFAALHSASTHRLALDPRPAARSAASGATPLPARARDAFPQTIERSIAVAATIGRAGKAAAGRGYDATAPPALS